MDIYMISKKNQFFNLFDLNCNQFGESADFIWQARES